MGTADTVLVMRDSTDQAKGRESRYLQVPLADSRSSQHSELQPGETRDKRIQDPVTSSGV